MASNSFGVAQCRITDKHFRSHRQHTCEKRVETTVGVTANETVVVLNLFMAIQLLRLGNKKPFK